MSRRARSITDRSFPWSDLDPERRGAVLLIGGIAVIVAIALALILYGYYTDRIAPKTDTVLTVGDRKFSYAMLERRVNSEYKQGKIDPQQVAQQVADTLTKLEREEVVRQTAVRAGVSVTPDDLDKLLRSRLRLPQDASRDVLAATYRRELLRLGVRGDEYEESLLADAVEVKLREQIRPTVPARTDYFNIGLIRTRTQADGDAAHARLDKGEAFATVAADVSTAASASSGGDQGWTPKGAIIPEVEAYALSSTGLSGVFAGSDSQYYIVDARGKETRDVDESGRNAVITFQLAEQLRKTADGLVSKYSLSADQIRRLVAGLADASV